MHHSGVDAHDTTTDYWAPTDKYHHKIASEPKPAKDYTNKPQQEYFNDSEKDKGRVWKPVHDTKLDGPSKAEQDVKKAKGEKVEVKEDKTPKKDVEGEKAMKAMMKKAEEEPKAAKKVDAAAKKTAPKPEAKAAPKPAEGKKEEKKPDIHLNKNDQKAEEKKPEAKKDQK